jgi:hypothetical protein
MSICFLTHRDYNDQKSTPKTGSIPFLASFWYQNSRQMAWFGSEQWAKRNGLKDG